MEVMKPFSKTVTIGAGLTSSLDLRDTSGVLLDCNSIKVVAGANIVTAGSFIVRPTSTKRALYADNSVGIGETSGVGGSIGRVERGVELSLPGQMTSDGITIVNNFAASITFLVVYGVKHETNSLKPNAALPKGA